MRQLNVLSLPDTYLDQATLPKLDFVFNYFHLERPFLLVRILTPSPDGIDAFVNFFNAKHSN